MRCNIASSKSSFPTNNQPMYVSSFNNRASLTTCIKGEQVAHYQSLNLNNKHKIKNPIGIGRRKIKYYCGHLVKEMALVIDNMPLHHMSSNNFISQA